MLCGVGAGHACTFYMQFVKLRWVFTFYAAASSDTCGYCFACVVPSGHFIFHLPSHRGIVACNESNHVINRVVLVMWWFPGGDVRSCWSPVLLLWWAFVSIAWLQLMQFDEPCSVCM